MTQGRLVLQGLVFHAYHGHCPEEAVLGGRFVVDVEIRLSLAEIQDDLSRTVRSTSPKGRSVRDSGP